MVTEFVLQNMASNKAVKFGQDIDCDYLYQSGGLDWGNIPASHHVYNYPDQIGSTFSSSKINERDISIEGYVYYILSDNERVMYRREQWAEYGYGKIKEKKKLLNELINPLDDIRLTIGEYYIEGKPSATVQYGTTEEENNVYFCEFLISIYCANPTFRKLTDVITVLSGDTGAFHFPMVIPPTGLIFGARKSYLMLAVQNDGDVEVGGKITISAKGNVSNPEIENVINGQKLRINKSMSAGETIVINTEDGSGRGVIGGTSEPYSSYLQYWDFTYNDWIKFEPGTSLIGYSSSSSSESLMEVSIQMNPAKFGLEEM